MNNSFENSVEEIAYLQFRADEYIDQLNLLSHEIITDGGHFCIESRFIIIDLIEELKPEIRDKLKRKIYAIKQNMENT